MIIKLIVNVHTLNTFHLCIISGYQQTPAYKEFQELKKRKDAEFHHHHEETDSSRPHHFKQTNVKNEYPSSNSPKTNGAATTPAPGPKLTSENGTQIPIFSEQFLEYSRKRESELRQLRKGNAVFEEQNAILNKQIDHMKSVMDRVKKDIIQQENENITVQNYLDQIRKILVAKFEKVRIPEHLAMNFNCENVESKLAQLTEFLNSSKGGEFSELKKKVREVVSKLDFPNIKEWIMKKVSSFSFIVYLHFNRIYTYIFLWLYFNFFLNNFM